MTSLDIQTRIENKLRDSLRPHVFDLINDSEKHRGHAGYSGNSHWRLVISSDAFKDLPLVKCHQMIYDILKDELKEEIHALSIKIV